MAPLAVDRSKARGPGADEATPAGGARVVGVILKAFPRLSETFILREILALEARGLELHLFALRDPREAAIHDDVGRVRAEVHYLPDALGMTWPRFLTSAVRLGRTRRGAFGPALRFALSRSLSERRFATLKRFLQAVYLVDRSLPGTGVSHLHAHFGHDPTSVAFFAAWLSGRDYSFSAHAKDVYAQDPAWLREKIARARFVVTCTEYNRQYLQTLAEPGACVLRAYHGIDATRFEPRPAGDGPSRPTTILSVGRLVPKKGFLTLVRALRRLADRAVPFRCLIVGEGPLRRALASEIASLGLQDRVEIAAPMPHRRLLDRFREADVFTLACEVQEDGDRDGIPNVIVEAMAMGLPVVATRVSGIPECVEDGVTGYLVTEKDPEALAERIARLAADRNLAARLGSAGRLKVEREFDAARAIDVIERALREALGGVAGEPREERHAARA